MKKTLYIIISLAVILMSACEDRNYRAFSDIQIKIEKSNVTFTAAGGTGSIVISADQSVTATSNESWCKTSLAGNTITVTVEPNLSMLGRTALITIKSGEKANYVPVSQNPVYMEFDVSDQIIFLGKGGTIVLPYRCSVEVPIEVVTEASWLTATVFDDHIDVTATTNPEFLTSRNTNIKIIVGDDLASQELAVIQSELITSYEPDPEANSIENFLNLKNDRGDYSTYKIVHYSARLSTLYNNLKAAYPVLTEIRIQAPRSSYKLSFILSNSGSYYYWNAANGLVPINESTTMGIFAFSGNSYSGTTAPYTGDTNYTQLREFFAAGEGFSIFPDLDDSNVYWLRSISDPKDYVKVEPI
jgi:hypothetical protein